MSNTAPNIETSSALGLAVLNALGVDSAQVMSVTIELRAHEPVVVTIRRTATQGQLTPLLERLTVVRRETEGLCAGPTSSPCSEHQPA